MKKILITLFFGILAPAMLSAKSIAYYQDEQNTDTSPFSTLTTNPNMTTEQSALTLSSGHSLT
ncbi:MAG: hypothetical protein GY821_17475 [Gammaproteobacteria bacterium]|nr:hypothetical protein [Gammaproteobacteria bacterium]